MNNNNSKERMTKEDLRIVFMGTPEFAVETLKILKKKAALDSSIPIILIV